MKLLASFPARTLMLLLLADPIRPEEGSEYEGDPSSLALADIITCKLKDVPTWNGFAFWFHDNEEAKRHYGMTAIKSNNPFLSEYRLATPLTLLGRTTDRVAFNNSGLMAVFPEVAPQALAKELGITPVIDAPGKYLGERTVIEAPFDAGSSIFQGKSTISLNVSTVTSHPGMVLAGCSYRIDIKD